MNLTSIHRFGAIWTCAHPAGEQRLPLDLLNLSHLLCVVKSPSTYNVPRRPRRWFPRGPLIPGTCSSSGSRASRPAATDARPGCRDPVRSHTVGRSSHYWQDTKPCNVLLFWPLGKLQSPFLSQKSTESEVPLQQWRSHGAAIPVIPMSPTSPVSPQPSPSPASPVSLTPPAVSTSPVQATGSNVSFFFYNAFQTQTFFTEYFSRYILSGLIQTFCLRSSRCPYVSS